MPVRLFQPVRVPKWNSGSHGQTKKHHTFLFGLFHFLFSLLLSVLLSISTLTCLEMLPSMSPSLVPPDFLITMWDDFGIPPAVIEVRVCPGPTNAAQSTTNMLGVED